MKRFALAAIAAVLIAGCGGGASPKHTVSHAQSTPTVGVSVTPCPAGSAMGCSVPHTFGLATTQVPRGPLVPDVSMWQGPHINWSAVRSWQRSHHWTPAAMIKLGETGYGVDPDALGNAARMHRLHMVVIGYWFVRAGTNASQVIAAGRAAGVHLIVLDEEVSGIQGEAGRLTPALKRAGFAVGVYHSASQVFDFSGGVLPCDVASYGPSSAPACPHRMGWQFTDGQWGPTVNIPGIGRGDVSVSYSLIRRGVKPGPAKCWGHGAHPKSKACKPIRSRYSRDVRNGKHWWKLARELRKAHS